MDLLAGYLIGRIFHRGLINSPSRCLPIEEILLLCLERDKFLKKCGNFAGKIGKGKVRGR